VIDPVTYKEIKRVPVGKEPHHLYLTPDNKSVMVANAASDSITFLDPNTGEVQRTLKGILDPYHLRFSPDMKWFVTAANRLNHIDIYRWEVKNGEFQMQLAKRLPAGKTPSHIAIDSKSTTAYFTLQDSHELMAVDLATQAIKWRVKTGPMPADVFGTPDDKHLLIGLTGSDGVEVYDVSNGPAKKIKKIPTGKGAHAFRAIGDTQHVLVSNRVANTISKIDYKTFTVVDRYPGPTGPDCMDITADGTTILLASRWALKLSVIDMATRKVVRQIKVGKSPHGVWTLDHAPRQ
jgi:YVTN family beta-propeller protein